MAISHTMSNPRNWPFQPYQDHDQNNISNNNDNHHLNDPISPTHIFEGSSSSSTSVLRNNSNNNNNNALSPDQGRVSKPIRRRSRASRRTPTTILNTNTSNFRAMVQQFTGSPTSPFVHQPQPLMTAANLSFGAPTTSGFHVQYPNQENMLYMIADHNSIPHGGGGGGGGRGGGEGSGFVTGFSSSSAGDDHRMF